MNYTVLVVGGFLIIAAVYWVAHARHVFKGPKRVDAAVFREIAMQAAKAEAGN